MLYPYTLLYLFNYIYNNINIYLPMLNTTYTLTQTIYTNKYLKPYFCR